MPKPKRKTDKLEDTEVESSRVQADENRDPNAQMQYAKLQAILEEFDLEVESRCLALQSQADQLAMGLRNALHMELMKLPKKVRTMSMNQFMKEYQGDWNSIGSRLGNASVLVSATPAKLPTVGAARFTIKLEDGKDLDLLNDTMAAAALNGKAKEEAKLRLMSLQSQLNQLMTALK